MKKTTTATRSNPVANDPEVVAFRAQFDERSPLDEIVRSGAQQMLQAGIDAEVTDFLHEHAGRRDEDGKRLVVRNGCHPERELLTGAGRLAVRQPRVRDNTADKNKRLTFTPSVLPPYLRRSKTIDELIPWLYLKGISTGDFQEALQSLLGEDAKGVSANVVVRLKETWGREYDTWNRRDLHGKEYVYVWADGIHANVRLEDEAGKRQCMLVLMGATVDGRKELVAVVDGYRESKQNWYELLMDLKQRGLTTPPKVAVGDGALGFWATLREVFGETCEQPAGSIRRVTSSTACLRASKPEQNRTSIKSGWRRRARGLIKRSTPSCKSTERSTRRPVNVSSRIATCCSRSTTSRPSTGSI